MQRPIRDPLAPAPASCQESDGEEIGVRESTPKRKGAKSPPRKKKTTEGEAEESLLLKLATVAKALPPTGRNAGTTKSEEEKEEYDAEKHLKKKSERYSHLWQVVLSSEEELSRSLKGSFLKLDDAEASVLNIKMGNQKLRENRLQLKEKAVSEKMLECLMELNHRSISYHSEPSREGAKNQLLESKFGLCNVNV